MKRENQRERPSLVVIQCDSGHLHGNLIACARNRIYDIMTRGDENQTTHVLFIIHLPRQLTGTLVGFQGDPWISIHIDDLIPVEIDYVIELDQMIKGVSISNIFIGQDSSEPVLNEQSEEGRLGVTENIHTSSATSDASSDSSSGNESIGTKDMKICESIESFDLTAFYFEESTEEETGKSENDSNERELVMADEIEYEEMEKTDVLVSQENLHETGSTRETICYSQNLFQLKSKRKPFFSRLHSCVPPAASRIKDFTTKRSTKRVNLLISLIPREIDEIGKFYESRYN